MNNRRNKQDYYSRLQDQGNQRAARLEDNQPMKYSDTFIYQNPHADFDLVGNYQTGVDYDKRITGGSALSYHNDNKMYSQQELEAYEKDFYEIYNKAKNYQEKYKTPTSNQTQTGGKRELGAKLRFIHETVQKMKDDGLYDNLSRPNKLKIAGYVLKDALKETGETEVNDRVREQAFKLMQNESRYMKIYEEEKAKSQKGGQFSRVSLVQEIAQKMTNMDRYRNIPSKDKLQIAKMVVDDAIAISDRSGLTSEVKSKAHELSKNASRYFEEYQKKLLNRSNVQSGGSHYIL